MKDEVYYFHQTPFELCKLLINEIQLEEGDNILEPFKGEGAFYNSFPDFVNKDWCEIEEGKDFKDYDKPIDWVITNPPFRLENDKGKRINSFYYLIDYYLDKINKGLAFLANDYCLSTLTPIRLQKMNDKGFFIEKIVVCNIKKWRGRYFFIIISKNKNSFFKKIIGSY